jgi:hypothetical protein
MEGKIERKTEEMSSFATEAGLRLWSLVSTCATGVGLGSDR